jgi:L-gulonolactone oxidase
MLVENFGGNIRFTPNAVRIPRNEEDVLALLEAHKTGRIRVVGALHSWSDAAQTDDVLVDMRLFDWVSVPERGDSAIRVTVGAGCRLQRLMTILRTEASLTLPTVGAVMQQTVAGAISTATHGSGGPSLSSYVTAIRVAAYDGQGQPAIYDWYDGERLQAARCGLGCTGIILSVTFTCVPEFTVSERVTVHDSIAPVLSAVAEHPLQEFALAPHAPTFVAYQRRVSSLQPAGWKWWALLLYRLYKLAVVDCFFHAALKILLLPCALGEGGIAVSNRLVKGLYRGAPLLAGLGTLLTGERGVVDRSDRTLTRKHHYFRHVEMEVFVPEAHVEEACALIRAITAVCANAPADMPETARHALAEAGLLDRVEAIRGKYLHHYPFYFRRVLTDDTLISMTSPGMSHGTSTWYAIGVFCYLGRRRRQRYFEYASIIGFALLRAYGARPHWGKYLPMFPEAALTSRDLEPVYPNLEAFRRQCAEIDPCGVFRSNYSWRVLGLAPVDRHAGSLAPCGQDVT